MTAQYTTDFIKAPEMLFPPHDIQNTIIHIMSQIVRQKISNDVHRAGYYSILVDETKDISKKEQMSIAI